MYKKNHNQHKYLSFKHLKNSKSTFGFLLISSFAAHSATVSIDDLNNTFGTIGTVSDWSSVTGALNGMASNNLENADDTRSFLAPTGTSFSHYNWTFNGKSGVTNDSSNNLVINAGNGIFSTMVDNTTNRNIDNYIFLTSSPAGTDSASITVNLPLKMGVGTIEFGFTPRRGNGGAFDGIGSFIVVLNGVTLTTNQPTTTSGAATAVFHHRTADFSVPTGGDYTLEFIMDNQAAGDHTVLIDNITISGYTPVELLNFSID